jgi:hypothetical protein
MNEVPTMKKINTREKFGKKFVGNTQIVGEESEIEENNIVEKEYI